MPVWSIPQWRAAVGAMAATAAKNCKNQKACGKTPSQKQNIMFTQFTFSFIFLLLSHTFESHQSIQYYPKFESQTLNHLDTVSKCTKRISFSSLSFFVLVLLVAKKIVCNKSLSSGDASNEVRGCGTKPWPHHTHYR